MKLRSGDVVGNRYEVRAALGEGGMGAVYEVFDRELDQACALKIMSADIGGRALSRARNEVKLTRSLAHPNIVDVYGLERVGDKIAIAMELVEGVTLSELVWQRGALRPSEVRWLAIELLRALEAAHGEEVLHCDIKPANVMVAEGKVHILDFGIAKLRSTAGDEQMAGTPGYLPPEVLEGEPPDARADLYALGATLFFALTRQRLSDAKNFDEARAQRPRDVARRLVVDDIGLKKFVLGLLAPKDSRPKSALAARAEIEQTPPSLFGAALVGGLASTVVFLPKLIALPVAIALSLLTLTWALFSSSEWAPRPRSALLAMLVAVALALAAASAGRDVTSTFAPAALLGFSLGLGWAWRTPRRRTRPPSVPARQLSALPDEPLSETTRSWRKLSE